MGFLGDPLGRSLKALMNAAEPLVKNPGFEMLLEHYETNMASQRGRIYLDTLNGFFSAYDDFNQLMPRYAAGLPFEDGAEVSSIHFDRTKMFYGNTFEALGSLVDLIAFSNNVLQGRSWDQFEKLKVGEYLKLDKIGCFKAFASVAGFGNLAVETDNHLRNASHHGSIEIDHVGQVVRYRAGKGGQGEERCLAYTKYLERCVVLFTQVVTLLCFELIVSRNRKAQPI